MPRQARLDAPGVLHHVMARGIERGILFRDDRDRDDWLQRLAGLAEAGAWRVYAWALLPNHFHLLARTGKTPLARGMRSLLTGYAGAFNRRHRRRGHLFQNRYKSIVCEDEPYLLALVRYLHLNPIRAGLVQDLKGLDRYPYSGHSALVGTVHRTWQETAEVLGYFGRRRSQAVARYRTFVAEGLGQGRRPELLGGGLVRSVGGWQAVRELRRGREAYVSDERVLGSSEFVEALLSEMAESVSGEEKRIALTTLSERLARERGVTVTGLRGGGRRRDVSRCRAWLAYVWVRHLGRSGRDLARFLGVSPQAVYEAVDRVEAGEAPSRADLARWCR